MNVADSCDRSALSNMSSSVPSMKFRQGCCHTSRPTISRNSVSRRSATVGVAGCRGDLRGAVATDLRRDPGSRVLDAPSGDHPPGSGASAERRQITVLLTPRGRGRQSRPSPAEPALPSIPERIHAERYSRGTETEIVGHCPIPGRDPKCSSALHRPSTLPPRHVRRRRSACAGLLPSGGRRRTASA